MIINNEWKNILENNMGHEFLKNLDNELNALYNNKTIYPPYGDIFNAFNIVKPNDIKVVIIGQDPYHEVGQAHGLAFSVKNDTKMPPSLRNIFKELKSDMNIDRTNTDLTDWAEQGIFLLNSILTVEEGLPLSHTYLGWEKLTDKIIEIISNKNKKIVFILWGNNARAKKKLINNENGHYIIESAHPSPLSASRGFLNSKPFSKTNKFLRENNIEEIRW